MSSLKVGKRVNRQPNKGIRHKVLSIACATLLCYLCATNVLTKGVKCLYINVLDKQCVFPIGLHIACDGAYNALIMADDGRYTDNQVGIYDGQIGGIQADGGRSQVGVRQVGIHTQGRGGFRYPNQGTVEKPTQTNPISPQTLFSQTNIIPTKFSNPYACACVRKSFSGGGGYRYPDYVGRV